MRIGVRSVLFSSLAALTLHFAGAKVVEAPNSVRTLPAATRSIHLGKWIPSEADLSVNEFSLTEQAIRLDNPNHTVEFAADSVRFVPSALEPRWHWRLTHVGDGQSPLEGVLAGPVSPKQTGDYVISYLRGAVIEQYLARAADIEQQFVIPEALELGGSDLVIKAQVESEGLFRATPEGWFWIEGEGAVRLGEAYVYDAEGVEFRLQWT